MTRPPGASSVSARAGDAPEAGGEPADAWNGAGPVAVNDGGACAVRPADGSVWCWGQGTLFTAEWQDPPPAIALRPRRIEGLRGARRLALVKDVGCALDDQQRIWCWGAPPAGMTPATPEGRPSQTRTDQPVAWEEKALAGATDLVGEHGLLCVVKAGEAFCRGCRQYDRTCLRRPSGAEPWVAQGGEGTVAHVVLDLYRTPGATGGHLCLVHPRAGNRLQCSPGTLAPDLREPVRGFLEYEDREAGLVDLWWLASGQLLAWHPEGEPPGGRWLPHRPFPAEVTEQAHTLIGHRDSYQCVLLRDGRVWCQARAGAEHLLATRPGVLHGQRQAGFVDPLRDGKSLAGSHRSAENHACVQTAQGEVWCWGENGSGQLGDGTVLDSSTPRRVSVP